MCKEHTDSRLYKSAEAYDWDCFFLIRVTMKAKLLNCCYTVAAEEACFWLADKLIKKILEHLKHVSSPRFNFY